MTAGAGILHNEMPPQEMIARGGLFHGVQLWVNLPRALKMTKPRYQDIHATDAVLLSSEDGGALIRVIAGSLAGHEGPGMTHTPITYLHAEVQPGATHWRKANWPCAAPATLWRYERLTYNRRTPRQAGRSWCWAASRSTNRWPATARS